MYIPRSHYQSPKLIYLYVSKVIQVGTWVYCLHQHYNFYKIQSQELTEDDNL